MAVWVLFTTCLVTHLVYGAQAQSQNQTPTTDAAEARALNSIFEQWGIEAQSGVWNISGELCSGRASPNDSATIDDLAYNPFIKCDCSYDNGATCHIVALKAYDRSIVGVLLEELWTLTFLTNLNLGLNYIRGPLSAAVGNLTRMQYLNFGINALSGELPKELGNLTDLRMLAIGSNNFSGPLPSEIGNLVKMDQLYMDSSGVSGEIPTTFAKLTNLHQIWASDTELTGRIPDFIGNYSKLFVLRLQGNSFEGPIPTSFSNLTSLTDLRISGLSNGSSSLAVINNMKSLSILILSNNNISGSIPSNIGEFMSLIQLDLSFNNLVGPIPDSIFSLTSLFFLFLGNNMLNGTLPEQKSSTLLNIDVSYNHLAGSFPSWVNNQTLQLNLVANNFTVGSSNSSVLPSGLNCLQRNFPCYRGLGNYYDFAIKCGGQAITSSRGIEYEKENETLGPATYFVTETNRWAVSNVGYFSGSNNPSYTSFSASEFRNTLDPGLFQTSRLSASSLRYYGLGLENGNYTVTLQFTEIAFPDSTTWRSLGRRVFDIYIQGNQVLKDFDIRKAAGGVSFVAVQRQFTVQVSENFMEIHLFWAGKGTCCIPAQGTYGPSISAISATPNFNPTVSNNPPTTKKSKTGLIAGVVGVGAVLLLAAFGFFFIVYRRKKLRQKEDEELRGIDVPARPYIFSYAELKAATEDFNLANKLGQGGFGTVYKGKLNDGRVVAVKQISAAGKRQFVTEIATTSVVQHRNIVKLYGCCIEGDNRLLIYEYLENKSLDQALFGKRNLNLDWATRFDICVGVARGIAHLHEESKLRIVHRNVKASNILLDGELIPKLSAFGEAKLYDDKKTHISTRVAGTIGYLAPEYAMRGQLTEKADVFAFGVVALELVSGRPNFNTGLEPDKVYLLEWAWHLHENNCEIEMVDSKLSEFNEEEVIRVIGIALLCTQTSPNLRPSMSRVLGMLSGDVEVTPVTSRPGYLTDWKFDDISNISMETSEDEELRGIDVPARPYIFSYAELKAATEDFNLANKLGEGGFGPVYKGKLNDGRVVAVKQLSAASHQGKRQFVTEIATTSVVQHRNIVKLYGCCIEGDNRLLIYEYLENKSLDQALFGKRNLNLDWATRFDICVGVARGLAHLHEESRLRIIHRDVKASNILLDGELIPKVSDFGLAKLYDDNKIHISTRVAGTIGYLAPEYAIRGHITEKTDVFAFGVVALELVSGRPNSNMGLEPDKVYLLEWAWHLHQNNCEIEMVDPNLSEFNDEEVIRVIGIALLCTQTAPNLRPSMSRALGMLSGDIEVTPVTSKPEYLTDWKFDDISNISESISPGQRALSWLPI